MKPLTLKAGLRREILRPINNGHGADVIFIAETQDGTPPTGKIEESRRGTFAGRNSKLIPLQAENRLRLGMLTRGYCLAVIPDQNVTIRFLTRHTQMADVLKYIAIGFGVLVGLSVLARVIFGDGAT